MAIATAHDECVHCGESIALRTYAAPYSADETERTYGVKLWTAGDGHYPGDQRFCESNVLADGYSTGDHEPAGVPA